MAKDSPPAIYIRTSWNLRKRLERYCSEMGLTASGASITLMDKSLADWENARGYSAHMDATDNEEDAHETGTADGTG